MQLSDRQGLTVCCCIIMGLRPPTLRYPFSWLNGIHYYLFAYAVLCPSRLEDTVSLYYHPRGDLGARWLSRLTKHKRTGFSMCNRAELFLLLPSDKA
jgi:hypothetical protein